jgi:hypothetical protein
MDQLAIAHQTIFADLLQKCLDAAFDEEFPENGSFTTQTHNGKSYYYYLGYEGTSGGQTEARKYTKYVGPADDPEIKKRVASFKHSKSGYKERRSLVASLRVAGIPVPPAMVGDVVEAMWKAGIFRLRGVLVGTLAYQTYAGLLGVKLPSAPIMTGDVDFAQFHSVSMLLEDTMPPMLETLKSVDDSFRERPHQADSRATTAFINAKGFTVEFLTPNRGSDDNTGHPAKMPALGGASAEPLRYLDFLIRNPVRSLLLYKGGVAVAVPAPERFAVHKLIVADRRLKDPASLAKARKDALQAGSLFEALTLNSMDSDLGLAWMEAWDRGPQWRNHLLSGLKRVSPTQKDLLRRAVVAACNEENKSVGDYGFTEEPEQGKTAAATP